MLQVNIVCAFVIAVSVNFVLSKENSVAVEDYPEKYSQIRPVGRAYSLTSCDYQRQVGYTCLACNRALHCYPGNVAILVDCYGLFRYCRDGRCSRFQGDKCFTDTKLTTQAPNNTAPLQTDVQNTYPIPVSEATTRFAENLSETVTENITATLTEHGENMIMTGNNVAESVEGKVAELTDSTNDPEAIAGSTQTVTETVIIPIDETASINSESNIV